MANTTTNDLLDAIDKYLQTKGKGTNYIANKVLDIFEAKNAPLNPKSGPLSYIYESFDDLRIAIKELFETNQSPLPTFKRSIGGVSKTLNKFNTKIKDLFTNLAVFDNHISNLKNIKPSNTKANSAGYKTKDGYLQIILHNVNQHWIRQGFPVFIKDVSDLAANKIKNTSQKERILQQTDTNNKNWIKDWDKIFKKPQNTNNNVIFSNSLGGKKGGMLGSILGLVGGGLGLAWIASEMDKTPEGKKLKDGIINIVTSSISTAFSKVGEFVSKNNFEMPKSVITKIGEGIAGVYSFVYNDVKKKLGAGEYLAAGLEGSAAVLLTSRIPIVGKLLTNIMKGFATFSVNTFIPTLIRTSLPFLLNPVSLSLIAGAAMTSYANNKINEFLNPIKQDYTEVYNKTFIKLTEASSLLDDKIKSLENKDKRNDITPLEEKQLLINKLQKEINDRDVEIAKRQKENIDRETNDGFISKLFKQRAYETRQEIVSVLSETQIKSIKSLKMLKDEYANLQKSKDSQLTRAQKTEMEAQKLVDEIRKAHADNPIKNITPTKVKDATVIQPDTKDQILMAKNGGPFDLAMKQMNNILQSKLEELIAVSSANVEATIMGSKAVAHTVAQTGGKSSTVSVQQPFNATDPIQLMRHKVNKFVG